MVAIEVRGSPPQPLQHIGVLIPPLASFSPSVGDFVVLFLWLGCSALVMLIGARLAQGKIGAVSISAAVLSISITFLVFGAVTDGGLSLASVNQPTFDTSIIAIVAVLLFLVNSRVTRLAACVLGIIALAVFSTTLSAAMAMLEAAGLTPAAALDVRGMLQLLEPVVYAALIFALLLLGALSLSKDQSEKRSSTLGILFLLSPILFGFAVTIGSFNAALTAILSGIQIFDIANPGLLNATSLAVAAGAFLSGLSGLLLMAGSSLGIAYLAKSMGAVSVSPEDSEDPRAAVYLSSFSSAKDGSGDGRSADASPPLRKSSPSADNSTSSRRRSMCCPFCGAELSGTESFCGHCGRKIQSMNFKRNPQNR